MNPHWLVPAHHIEGHDALIDVRTPAEFAEDHVPGAINCPVLSDEERVQIGTLYRQVSPFEARKLGAALVVRNIAQHIEQQFADKPKNWRPLVYCWRGGQRSGAMQIVLRQIGWQADKLDGGYKAFRNHVMAQTALLAPQFEWHVLCGATGNAKTRILQAVAAQGGQVLDLETIAAHKGSVLGALPGQPQPGQKQFETLLWQHLRQLDAQRPVLVEAESRKIGKLHLPGALIDAMRQGARVEVQANIETRTAFLLRDYAYALDADWLNARLDKLTERQGRKTVQAWKALAAQGQWPQLVQALLEKHYDPLYRQSQGQNYAGRTLRPPLLAHDLSDAAIADLARQLLAA